MGPRVRGLTIPSNGECTASETVLICKFLESAIGGLSATRVVAVHPTPDTAASRCRWLARPPWADPDHRKVHE